MARSRGFLELLFDFSFSEFVALKIVGVLYGIAIFFAGLFALGLLLAGWSRGWPRSAGVDFCSFGIFGLCDHCQSRFGGDGCGLSHC